MEKGEEVCSGSEGRSRCHVEGNEGTGRKSVEEMEADQIKMR